MRQFLRLTAGRQGEEGGSKTAKNEAMSFMDILVGIHFQPNIYSASHLITISMKMLCKLNSCEVNVEDVGDGAVGASRAASVFSLPTPALVAKAPGQAPFSFSSLSLVAVSLTGSAAVVVGGGLIAIGF